VRNSNFYQRIVSELSPSQIKSVRLCLIDMTPRPLLMEATNRDSNYIINININININRCVSVSPNIKCERASVRACVRACVRARQVRLKLPFHIMFLFCLSFLFLNSSLLNDYLFFSFLLYI